MVFQWRTNRISRNTYFGVCIRVAPSVRTYNSGRLFLKAEGLISIKRQNNILVTELLLFAVVCA